MFFLGKLPDIEKMKTNKDVKGLLNLLRNWKDHDTSELREEIIAALK